MLEQALNKAFANTFTMYLKSHNFHWNCEGQVFYQYHKFFEEIYTEVYGSVDTFAEHIRACGYYAPATMVQFSRLTDVVELDMSGQPAVDMAKNLLQANELVLISLYQAYQEAENAKEMGLANFIQDRIGAHNKHSWFLKSQSK